MIPVYPRGWEPAVSLLPFPSASCEGPGLPSPHTTPDLFPVDSFPDSREAVFKHQILRVENVCSLSHPIPRPWGLAVNSSRDRACYSELWASQALYTGPEDIQRPHNPAFKSFQETEFLPAINYLSLTLMIFLRLLVILCYFVHGMKNGCSVFSLLQGRHLLGVTLYLWRGRAFFLLNPFLLFCLSLSLP